MPHDLLRISPFLAVFFNCKVYYFCNDAHKRLCRKLIIFLFSLLIWRLYFSYIGLLHSLPRTVKCIIFSLARASLWLQSHGFVIKLKASSCHYQQRLIEMDGVFPSDVPVCLHKKQEPMFLHWIPHVFTQAAGQHSHCLCLHTRSQKNTAVYI